MKLFLLFVSALAWFAYISNAEMTEVCAWVDSVKTVIDKFSPDGRQTVLNLLKTFQFYIGAAVQPFYLKTVKNYQQEIDEIIANDGDLLAQLTNLLG